MPQKIIVFSTIDEAIFILRPYSLKFSFPRKKLSKGQIIKDSVSSNIFRAFTNLNVRPSEIYRDWANEYFDSILIDFGNVNSKKDYYDFLFKYADSLIQRWAWKTMKPDKFLMYGPALKMVNLLIKTSQQSIDHKIEEKILFQQVPLDSFSLIPLKSIINQLTGLNYKINIPNNATMGFINTPQIYRIIMDSVYNLCEKIKIPPIIYDYWCWEDKHK